MNNTILVLQNTKETASFYYMLVISKRTKLHRTRRKLKMVNLRKKSN